MVRIIIGMPAVVVWVLRGVFDCIGHVGVGLHLINAVLPDLQPGLFLKIANLSSE